MKKCRIFMTGFGLAMLLMAFIMAAMTYHWRADARSAMAKIHSGSVSAIRVKVSGVYSRRIKRSTSSGNTTWALIKYVSFVSEDGQRFEKAWSREITQRHKTWFDGYVVDGHLYVPGLYDELKPRYGGFLIFGLVFFILFWLGGLFVCRWAKSQTGR